MKKNILNKGRIDFKKDADKYARDVLNNKIVACNNVKMACQRYFDFLDNKDFIFKEESLNRVGNFIQNLKHFEGPYAGKHFILEPWQIFVIANIFGFYYANEQDIRVTNKVFLLMARKQGKSMFVAAIALYCLIADHELGQQIINVANSAKQAKTLFNMEVHALESIDPKKKYFKTTRDTIRFERTNSFSAVMASYAKGLDSYNCGVAILDETHEMLSSSLWDVLISSQGARKNPLAIQISTAGYHPEGFCKQYRDTAIEILLGRKEDEHQFSLLFELDEGDKWDDPKVWKKSNPNLGITVYERYLRDQINAAKLNPQLEVGVKTKNLNMWCSTSETWIPDSYINSTMKDFKFEWKNYKNKYAYVGVDLSSVADMSALSFMIFDDKSGTYIFKNYYFLPEIALKTSKNKELYRYWKQEKWLIITPGNTIDYDTIINYIQKINQKYSIIIVGLYYDPYNSTQFITTLSNLGYNCIPFSQGIGNFSGPSKELERIILNNQAKFDNNPITNFCFRNVIIKEDWNSNIKPIKTIKENKIDGVIASIQALGGFLTDYGGAPKITAI